MITGFVAVEASKQLHEMEVSGWKRGIDDGIWKTVCQLPAEPSAHRKDDTA